MKTFTDDEMNALLPTAKAYSVVILKQGPKFTDDTAPASSGNTVGATSGYATTACSRWSCRSPMAPTSAASGCLRHRRRDHRDHERRPRRGSRECSPSRCTPVADFPATRCRSRRCAEIDGSAENCAKNCSNSIRRRNESLDQLGHPQVGDRQLELADVELVGAEVAKPGGTQRPGRSSLRCIASRLSNVDDDTARHDVRSIIRLALQKPSSSSIAGSTDSR